MGRRYIDFIFGLNYIEFAKTKNTAPFPSRDAKPKAIKQCSARSLLRCRLARRPTRRKCKDMLTFYFLTFMPPHGCSSPPATLGRKNCDSARPGRGSAATKRQGRRIWILTQDRWPKMVRRFLVQLCQGQGWRTRSVMVCCFTDGGQPVEMMCRYYTVRYYHIVL